MKTIAIILFVLQGISLLGAATNGTLISLFTVGGAYGLGRLIGYFFPSIIGLILLAIHNGKQNP